jgi:hypothetical protein
MYKNEIADINAEDDKILFTDINRKKEWNPSKDGSVEDKRRQEFYKLRRDLERKQRIVDGQSDKSANKMAVKEFIIDDFGDYVKIDKVPAKIAKSLPVCYGFIDLEEAQNDSPNMREMIELAVMYNGMLGGYVITTDSERDDAGIIFESLILPITADVAAQLNEELKPDEFSVLDDGSYRLWWD